MLQNNKVIVSMVVGVQVTLSNDSISKATRYLHEGNTYHEGWEKAYDSHITRALYKDNTEKVIEKKTIIYNLILERAKI